MTQYQEKIVGKPGGLVEPGVKQYGFFKKIFKPIKKIAKKVIKSPLGKAALIGGLGSYGMGMGPLGGLKGAGFLRNIPSYFGSKGALGDLFFSGEGAKRKFSLGKAGLMGLLGAGITMPFLGDDEEEVVEEGWENTPASIANIGLMARNRDPSLSFLPPIAHTQSGFYNTPTLAAKGGIVGLANGGVAEAQAEQMLKMEYQKYRNQGGTMSYQQFKMTVLKQAQGQGPMAQEHLQTAANGGRIGFQQGGWNPGVGRDTQGYQSNHPSFGGDGGGGGGSGNGGNTVTGQTTVINPVVNNPSTIDKLKGWYGGLWNSNEDETALNEIRPADTINLGSGKLSETKNILLDNRKVAEDIKERFDPNDPNTWAHGGRVGAQGGGLMGSHVPGYTTPPGYNRFDYPSGGVRVGRAEGGIMDLGGMEKDYRSEGGFVPIGGQEKADDVPARLSKNEFVFTADAVRSAGGGDIDAGAEVMQNMMDNLEQGGQISEESQGAQGMYNNMKQLETRVA